MIIECVKAVSAGLSLKHVNPLYRSEEDVVLASVTRDGLELRFQTVEYNIEYLDEDLYYTSDLKYVIPALRQNGLALQYVRNNIHEAKHKYLRIFRDWAYVVMTAVRQNPYAFQFVTRGVRLMDKNISVKNMSKLIEYCKNSPGTIDLILLNDADRTYLEELYKESPHDLKKLMIPHLPLSLLKEIHPIVHMKQVRKGLDDSPHDPFGIVYHNITGKGRTLRKHKYTKTKSNRRSLQRR